MNAKYADVVKTSEILAYLETLPIGMFDLPSGTATAQHEQKQKRTAHF
jgi:maleamate amidohydrolase